MISGVSVAIAPFFGLNCFKGSKFLDCVCWINNDNINYGVNFISGEHNVNSSTRRM
jgi:hypothetical protein